MSSQEEVVAGGVEQEARETLDFRMVSFSLGGRDYGIDIMDVKEISKVETFTYVPNTATYVRGVVNLRGEIISIIDLREMFHLPVSVPNPGEPEDVLFLRSEDRVIGVIVDRVNEVVGVASESIQPPHPLFGDINVSFIRGVVESGQLLYVILDTEMVFGDEFQGMSIREASPVDVEAFSSASLENSSGENLNFTFVQETLQTFSSFYVSEVNERWTRKRFETWVTERGERSESVQLQSREDADAFLLSFPGSNTGALWSGEYLLGVKDLLPEVQSPRISGWVIGAGAGYDAYSLACLMHDKYPRKAITIWAHDDDLLKISSAPTLTVDSSTVEADIARHLIQGSRGSLFSEEIRNSIFFEYHDVLHDDSIPEVQIVFVRDFLSFLPEGERMSLLDDIARKTPPDGRVFVGDNEQLPEGAWKEMESHGVRCYKKA